MSIGIVLSPDSVYLLVAWYIAFLYTAGKCISGIICKCEQLQDQLNAFRHIWLVFLNHVTEFVSADIVHEVWKSQLHSVSNKKLKNVIW